MAKPKSKPKNELPAKFQAVLSAGQMLESLFDCVPSAIFFVKDRESRFVGGSLSFAQSLGLESIEEMIGKTDSDYSPDFLTDGIYADDQRVFCTGQAIYGKVELVPFADGSLDWLRTTKVPLFDAEGLVVGLAGVARIIRDSDAVYAKHPEMRRIVDFARAHYREKISVRDMAKEAGISVSSQERLFRKLFGLTPSMYLRRTRLNAACAMLRNTTVELAQIAPQCGFNVQTHMTRAFSQELNVSPHKYRLMFSKKAPVANRRSALRS